MLECSGAQSPTSPSFATYGSAAGYPWEFAGQSPMGCQAGQMMQSFCQTQMGDSLVQQSPMGCQMIPNSFGQAAMQETCMPNISQPIMLQPAVHPTISLANEQLCHQSMTSPSNNGGSWSHEDMMAALIPGGTCVDKEMLAQQLRAAAPTCYDD